MEPLDEPIWDTEQEPENEAFFPKKYNFEDIKCTPKSAERLREPGRERANFISAKWFHDRSSKATVKQKSRTRRKLANRYSIFEQKSQSFDDYMRQKYKDTES